jgi:hypothetical protein
MPWRGGWDELVCAIPVPGGCAHSDVREPVEKRVRRVLLAAGFDRGKIGGWIGVDAVKPVDFHHQVMKEAVVSTAISRS